MTANEVFDFRRAGQAPCQCLVIAIFDFFFVIDSFEQYNVDSEEFSLKERRGSTEVRYRGGRGDWFTTTILCFDVTSNCQY